MDLKNKVAIVTGAGGAGQGRALAIRLAARGALVVVSDIDESGAQETCSMITSSGATALSITANVEREADVISLVSAAEAAFGGIDVMVNSAGPFFPGEFMERWRSTAQANFMGALYGTMHVVEPMRKRGGGAIIYYGSTSALGYGYKHSSDAVYDAAKAGVATLASGLAWMRDAYNIRTSCIVPDWVATAEVRAYWQALTPQERLQQGVPSRLTGLDEISDAVLRLITDESLYGRVLVWWSEDEPRLISVADRGHSKLEPFELQ